MAVEKEDRRIKRTKKMLRKALAELMCEKEFKDITVKDITERADLNRGTFYLHYCDTYDLLEKVENELIDTFVQLIENYRPTQDNLSAFDIINQIFDYIEENQEICRIMFVSPSGNSYLNKLIDVITEKGFEVQKGLLLHNADKIQSEYNFCFLGYGIIGIIRRWFSEEGAVPREELVKIIDNIILSVLMPRFERSRQ